MARKKEEIVENQVLENTQVDEETLANLSLEGELAEAEAEADLVNDSTDSTEIPERIKEILKLYPECKKLYVDNKGGVYSTPYGSAKLYKNPYFKKNK